MTQKILEIQVPQPVQEEEEILQAGNMYEHNATALQFLLDAVYLQSDYRYYAEFVTVKGVARTEYLTLTADGKVTVSIPQEITSQMTAMCVFNIVQIGTSGKTEQLIKAKKVRLYFSDLENTERMLDVDYAFSVNTLLEAIYAETFKGDKGDKGDAYVLTDADKTEIAGRVNQAFYGLPMEKHMMVRGARPLSGAADNAVVSTLTVKPAECTSDGVKSVQIAIGKNILADILDSSLYNKFPATEGTYAAIPLNVKPNTSYILAKLSDDLAEFSHSYLKADTRTIWLCHKTNQNLCTKYAVFTSPANGQCALYTTYIYLSQNAYRQILDTDWAGLTLMEQDSSVLLQKTFSEPLYAVSSQIGDSYDFVSGILTRRTAKALLTSAQMISDSTVQLTDTAYRYKLSLPEGAPERVYGCAAGICTELPAMTADASNASEYAAYTAESGESEGIWFGAYDDGVYIVSLMEPDAFAAWLDARSVEILYATAEQTEIEEATAVHLPVSGQEICVSPNQLCAELHFSADISAVANDLESRITSLENKI